MMMSNTEKIARKINSEVDMGEDLEALLVRLPERQMKWLVRRVMEDTDIAACGDKEDEFHTPVATVSNWKSISPAFYRAYELAVTRHKDFQLSLVMAIERFMALRAVTEKAILISTPWAGMGAREISAKTQLITDTLDRIAPKTRKTEAKKSVTLIDLTSKESNEDKETL